MRHWEKIHTDVVDGFDVTLYVTPEDENPADHFKDAEIVQDIREGRLDWFIAKVSASKHGVELADDYLGACCYESTNSFIKDPYYIEMVQNVIIDAKAMIQKLTKE